MVENRRYTALVNAELTPRQAMVADLLFVRELLVEAGIRFHLIRGNDVRPVLVIDNADRERLRDTLVSGVGSEPLLLVTEGKKKLRPPVLVSEGLLQLGPKDRSVIVYRPRVAPFGGLSYGPESGVRIESWIFSDEVVEAPGESALTRTLIPRAELVETTVEKHGCTWLTFERQFDTLASDITFDIDMVFSWVDGTDLEFQRARARQMQSYVVGEGDDHEARFRQLDELRYALRSVHLFAPWVRRIFVVTDSPAPYWLADHPGVTFVRSEEFFADPSVLPTHNSQAVESQLHHIPGIAEHFLYSNDDMFFGRAVTPDMFFTPGGATKFVEATTRIGLGTSNTLRSGFENSARVNRALLADRFRSATDISVTNSLYHYYALLTGRAMVQQKAKVRYVDTTMRAGLVAMEKLLVKRNVDMFCLNDGSFPEISTDERAEAVRSFLDNYFPVVAPWERVEAIGSESRAG